MKILIVFSLLFAATVFAQEDKKIYSQEEFDKKLKYELDRMLKKVKKGELTSYTEELLKKEREISNRELQLKMQKEKIEKSSETLTKRVADFQKSQTNFLSCLDDVDKKNGDRLSHIVSAISGMKPQKAADLLSVQDDKIAVQILGLLDAVKVSKIFNLMDKEKSASLQKQYLTMKK